MEIKRDNPPTDRDNRRRGSAFDTLAHVFRDVREFLFQNGFTMRNRAGLGRVGNEQSGDVPVNNMMEAYYEEGSADKINAFILGRRGDGTKRNAHLIELTANHRPEQSALELGFNNGVVKLRSTREGEDPAVDRTGVTVADPNALSAVTLPTGVVIQVVGQGEFGGVILSHVTNRGDVPTTGATGGRTIRLLDDGIYLTGLPTSNPGGTNRLWRDGTTLRIT